MINWPVSCTRKPTDSDVVKIWKNILFQKRGQVRGHEAVCLRVVCLRVRARARARAAMSGWMHGRGYLCFSIFLGVFF